MIHLHIAEALFLNACPDKPMWNIRGQNLCGYQAKYMCLYDANKRKYRELCKDEPEFHRPGIILKTTNKKKNNILKQIDQRTNGGLSTLNL